MSVFSFAVSSFVSKLNGPFCIDLVNTIFFFFWWFLYNLTLNFRMIFRMIRVNFRVSSIQFSYIIGATFSFSISLNTFLFVLLAI